MERDNPLLSQAHLEAIDQLSEVQRSPAYLLRDVLQPYDENQNFPEDPTLPIGEQLLIDLKEKMGKAQLEFCWGDEVKISRPFDQDNPPYQTRLLKIVPPPDVHPRPRIKSSYFLVFADRNQQELHGSNVIAGVQIPVDPNELCTLFHLPAGSDEKGTVLTEDDPKAHALAQEFQKAIAELGTAEPMAGEQARQVGGTALRAAEVLPVDPALAIADMNLDESMRELLQSSGLQTLGDLLEPNMAEQLGLQHINKSNLAMLLDELQSRRIGVEVSGYHDFYFSQMLESPISNEQRLTNASELYVEELELDTKAFNLITRCGKRMIDDLCTTTALELQAIPGLGAKSLLDITAAMNKLGYTLGSGIRD